MFQEYPDRVSAFVLSRLSTIPQYALGVIYGILLQSLDADHLHR